MPENNQEVATTSTLSRTFNYQLNGVQLNFTLRVDVKDELEAFSELLRHALTDVNAEIAK